MEKPTRKKRWTTRKYSTGVLGRWQYWIGQPNYYPIVCIGRQGDNGEWAGWFIKNITDWQAGPKPVIYWDHYPGVKERNELLMLWRLFEGE